MKAVILKEFGDTSQLEIADVPTPEIKADEVLIMVKAIGINPVDVKTRAGKGLAGRLKDEQPLILGWDISGTVVKAGEAVTDFETGDEVFGMINFPGHGKAYAGFIAAPSAHIAHKPANISHEEAAAATLAALTAWQAITQTGKLKAGQRVLIHAAAGGVGHYAVQIAKHYGAYVVGTSSAINRDFVLGLGADQHIDYKAVNFETAVKDIDLVLDTIGGDNIDRSLEITKQGGTIISLPSGLNQAVTEKAAAKGINGCTFMVQSNGRDMKQLAGLLKKSIIKSHISQTFPFHEIGNAHLQIEGGKTKGKVVIQVLP